MFFLELELELNFRIENKQIQTFGMNSPHLKAKSIFFFIVLVFYCLLGCFAKDHHPFLHSFITCVLGSLKRDVPCSLADILRHSCLFLLVKLLLLTSYFMLVLQPPLAFPCLPIPFLCLTYSIHPWIPLCCLWANNGSVCVFHKRLFMVLCIEFLKLYLYWVMLVRIAE